MGKRENRDKTSHLRRPDGVANTLDGFAGGRKLPQFHGSG
jgi:hypothetical protein